MSLILHYFGSCLFAKKNVWETKYNLKKIVKAMHFMQVCNWDIFYWDVLLTSQYVLMSFDYASEMTSNGLSGMLSPSIGNLSHLLTL